MHGLPSSSSNSNSDIDSSSIDSGYTSKDATKKSGFCSQCCGLQTEVVSSNDL
jgi:hypothetical protein